MTYYVESGRRQQQVECATQIQAALIFLLTFEKVGQMLMVSSVPFAERMCDCPPDASFWSTEELREEIAETKREPRIVKEDDLFDSRRKMVGIVAN